MLKLINAVVAGLEVTYNSFSGGGTSSALQALEISHTHYWSRDLSDPHVLDMSGGSSALSQVHFCSIRISDYCFLFLFLIKKDTEHLKDHPEHHFKATCIPCSLPVLWAALRIFDLPEVPEGRHCPLTHLSHPLMGQTALGNLLSLVRNILPCVIISMLKPV